MSSTLDGTLGLILSTGGTTATLSNNGSLTLLTSTTGDIQISAAPGFNVIVPNQTISGPFTVNGSAGVAGQTLTSGGPSGNAVWSNAGAGSVTDVSIVPANGLTGSVATSTSTPAITLGTTITGIAYGDGTGFLPVTIGAGLSFSGGTLSATGSGTVTSISVASANGFAGASSGGSTPTLTLTTSVSGLLYGNAGALSPVTIGAGLSFVGGTLSNTGGGATYTGQAPIVVTGTVISIDNSAPVVLDLAAGSTVTGATITGGTITTAAITASSLDSTVIGAATPAAAFFTDLDIVGLAPRIKINGDPGTAGYVLTSGGPAADPYWSAAAGSGTVTNVSGTTANGFVVSTTNPTTTPVISVGTALNGLISGNGTGIVAATGAEVAAALGSTPVPAANAITNSGPTGWNIVPTATKLEFYYGITLVASLDLNGTFTALKDINANATP